MFLKTYLMSLSDCYDCELDFVKKEILHTRTVYEGSFIHNPLLHHDNSFTSRYGEYYFHSAKSN